MTVHGAKGLEAPVVILADATADPARMGRTPTTVDLEIGPGGVVPLLRPKKDERSSPFTELVLAEEKRALEEHWRLLYVALTRSADRLIVTGVAPKPKRDGSESRPANCWHVAVERAMASLGAEAADDGKWGSGLVHGLTAPEGTRPRAARPLPPTVPIPAWALEPALPEEHPPRPLAPSAIAIDDEIAPPPSEAARASALRGTWIHQLLERLPALEQGERAVAADHWLERSAGVSDEGLRNAIVEEVCAILADSRFSPLFGPGSLGEAPLAATLLDGRVIAGTVDRLLVEERRVLVIDFKTGRVPSSHDEIPRRHQAQIEAYVEALRMIFPGREVCAALLYTAGPKLIEMMP
jgi:ATP-dependent helicase/nuclease subunit A